MENTRFEITSPQDEISRPDSDSFPEQENDHPQSNSQHHFNMHKIYQICAKKCCFLPYNDQNSNSISISGPIANLCSATLGAGVLALPFAMSTAGLGLGIILLTIAAVSTIISIDMLVQSCAEAKLNSFERLTVVLFGPKMGWVVEANILCFCFGICVAYIVAVGDILEQGVIGSLKTYHPLPSFVTREFTMIVFWAFVMFPLSLFERINALRYASLFGVSSIFFLVFAVSFHSIRTLVTHHDSHPLEEDMFLVYGQDVSDNKDPSGGGNGIKIWPESFFDAIRACPIILFAFNCQVNVPAIFDELPSTDSTAIIPTSTNTNKPCLSLMKQITRGAIKICFFLYITMGSLAYLEYGNTTQDNVLKNYCVQVTHDPLMILAFCGITFSIVLAFPLNVFPSRITLDIIVSRFFNRAFSNTTDPGSTQSLDFSTSPIDPDQEPFLEEPLLQSDTENNDNPYMPSQSSISHQIRHFLLTLGISGTALFVAIIVPDISIVFGLMGGFASSLFGLIMPAAFYLELGLASNKISMKICAWSLIVTGVIISILSTGVTIYSIFQVDDKVDVCDNNSFRKGY